MFTNKIYDFLKFTYICLKYKTLNFICHILSINCSEYDRLVSLTENSLQETNSGSFENISFNSNIIFIPSPGELKTEALQMDSIHENSSFNLPGIEEMHHTQDDAFKAEDHSDLDFLTKNCSEYSLKNPSEKLCEDFVNYISRNSLDTFEIISSDQNDGITLESSVTYESFDLLSNQSPKYIVPSECPQTIPEPTTSVQQIELPAVLDCKIENEEQNVLKQEMEEDPLDISTALCSTNCLSNSLIYKEYMDIKVYEENMEVINIAKIDSNNHVGQTDNNQSLEDSYSNKHIQKKDKSSETIFQVSKEANYTSMNPNTNMNLRSDNKRSRSPVLHFQKKLRLRKEKNIQQIKIFKLVVNEKNLDFPSDLNELKFNEEYNLKIQIFSDNKKSFEKTFVFKIEEKTTSITRTNKPCQRITYSISFIPKFFVPVFHEFKEILTSKKKQMSKHHDFYYRMRRIIELQQSEELKITHLVPDLIPNEDHFWRKKYTEVIRDWLYKSEELDKNGKPRQIKILHFLKTLPSISKGKEIRCPILGKIFDIISSFNNHIQHMMVHDYTPENFKKGCLDILDFGKQFYASEKLESSLNGLNPTEIKLLRVYNTVYQNYMWLLLSILDCYNEFIRKDNEDRITYK